MVINFIHLNGTTAKDNIMLPIIDFSKNENSAPALRTVHGQGKIYQVDFNKFIVDRWGCNIGVEVLYCVNDEGWGDFFAYIGVWNLKYISYLLFDLGKQK